MSNFELVSSVSDRIIRQELIFVSKSDFGDRNIPAIMQQVGVEALSRKKAYLRGEVIGSRGPLTHGTLVEALYVAMPVYFPDSFHTYHSSEGYAIVLAWLVPISSQEAKYIQTHGWDGLNIYET